MTTALQLFSYVEKKLAARSPAEKLVNKST